MEVSATLTGSTEANWDFIDIYNGAGTLLESFTGSYGTLVVFSDDNGITVQFDSDSSVSGYTSSWTVACVDDSAVMGCMDSTALNYNADATMDDGSCTYPLSTTVTLPFDFDGTNCGSGNDVNSTTLGYTEYYAGGEDAVFDLR